MANKKYLIRKKIRFLLGGLEIVDTHKTETEAEAKERVARWVVGNTYGGGWLGPKYKLLAVDYIEDNKGNES